MSTVDDIIVSLQPDFKEYASNENFFHWMDYACELDELALVAEFETDDFVDHLNERIRNIRGSSARHDACVDVASTLESLPDYKGKFKYD